MRTTDLYAYIVRLRHPHKRVPRTTNPPEVDFPSFTVGEVPLKYPMKIRRELQQTPVNLARAELQSNIPER